MTKLHWGTNNMDCLEGLKMLKDESIDLEKIINEYNTKLNMIKKENVMMSNQASFSIIDNKKNI